MKPHLKFLIPLLMLGLLACFFFYQKETLPGVRSDQYQAVFLNNGQVYFGKLKNRNRNFVVLNDVYYLKFAQGLQQGEVGSEESGRNLNLIRLGGEAHGPEREMYINKDSISFYENLKSDSSVVQAILKTQK